jgi:TfoX/Sxy family transcriptional regulator of competence genes
MAYDEKTAERMRKLLSSRRDVVEKKLMGGLTFMVKGAMCCSASGRGGILVRVGPATHERMLAEPHVRPVEMAGRTVAGFVRVDPDGYATDAALRKWIQRGLDFVDTLPAAPSRKASPGKPVKRKAPKRRAKAR